MSNNYFKSIKPELPSPVHVRDLDNKLLFIYINEYEAELARAEFMNSDIWLTNDIIYCIQEEDVKIVSYGGYYNTVEISLIKGDIQ